MQVYIGRQPVLDRRDRVFGYELLFRSGATEAYDGLDGDISTSKVIDHTLHLGLETLTQGTRALINFTENLLMSEVPTLLPKELIGVEILEDIHPQEKFIQACQKLKAEGYLLLLDDFIITDHRGELLEYCDIVKVDFRQTPPDQRHIPLVLASYGIKLLAEKVETQEDYLQAKQLGYSYFQGYYFCRPALLTGRSIDLYSQTLSMVLAEVSNPDVKFRHLARLVSEDVGLAYKLLRIINSSAIGLRNRVNSIEQALVLLGTKEIRRWLSLLAIQDLGTNKPHELTVRSLIRARFGETLAGKNQADVFLMGLFSLIDAFLDQPMPQAIGGLPLSEEISKTLLGEETSYSRIYQLLLAYEQGEWERVSALGAMLGLGQATIAQAFIDSVAWSNQVLSV